MPKAKKGQKNNRRKAEDDITKKLILATAVINVLNAVISLIDKVLDYIK